MPASVADTAAKSAAKMTKERGIVLTAEMVQAILHRRKTQMRFVIGGRCHRQPVFVQGAGSASLWSYIEYATAGEPSHWIEESFEPIRERLTQTCPYGSASDILWVKEAWAAEHQWNDTAPSAIRQTAPVWYLADGPGPGSGWTGKTRLPLHMPRWFARIRLEITSVAVERLQDITDEDARQEGVRSPLRSVGAHRDEFKHTWDRNNAATNPSHGDSESYCWDDNPWVWTITFHTHATTRTLEATKEVLEEANHATAAR